MNKNINLFDEMEKMVDLFVQGWKDDLDIDKKIIRKNESNTYYWLVRKNGTWLTSIETLAKNPKVKHFTFYHDNRDFYILFRIDIKKRINNDYIGTIQAIGVSEYESQIHNYRIENNLDFKFLV